MLVNKWITDLSAATPVPDAARRVLALRLENVRDCLGQTLREPGKDPEYVHQLRVATRRASAALEIFADCLPPKVYNSARKLIRDIRRAAAAARDWDVFLARLIDEAPQDSADDRAAVDLLVGYVMAHRIPAQKGLEDSCRNYPFGFERCMAETMSAIHYRDGRKTPLATFARPLLRRLFDELNQAAACNHDDYPHLHQVRIVGKRLRYTIEMFVDCFGPALRNTLYPAIAKMQEILGEVNDHFNAMQLFTTLRTQLDVLLPQHGQRYLALLDRLKAAHETQLQEGARRFRLWWESWQKAEIQMAIADLQAATPINWPLLHTTDANVDPTLPSNGTAAGSPRGEAKRTA